MKLSQVLVLFSCCWLLAVTAEIKKVRHTEGDPDLENYLREAIENFREQMPKGIPEINMPVLDPLNLQDMDIQVNENIATMNLKLKEMTIRDLSKFKIQRLTPDLEKLFIKTTLSLPFATASGKYKVNGKLLKILPLYGEGDFQINITDAQISGEGKLGFVEDTLQMTSLDLDLLWKDLTVYLENFLGGGKFSNVLQKLLPKIGKGIFDNFKPGIMRLIEQALRQLLNQELRKPEVKDIIAGIIPKGPKVVTRT